MSVSWSSVLSSDLNLLAILCQWSSVFSDVITAFLKENGNSSSLCFAEGVFFFIPLRHLKTHQILT